MQGAKIFQDIQILANLFTKERNYFTYILGYGLITKEIRPYFYSWYAYFRWVDDLADSPGLSDDEKQQFLQRQLMLVRYLYDHLDDFPMCKTGELFLASLISYDINRGSNLKDSLIDLLSCIDYDIKRLGDIPSQIELERFIELEVTSYLKILYYFCDPTAKLRDFPKPYEGIAGKLAHILRDFILDLENGIINISKEEVIRFKIKENNLWEETYGPAFKEWVQSKVREARLNFTKGKDKLLRHHCLRYKVAVAILCAKYENLLNSIEQDSFTLRRNYHNNLASALTTRMSFIFYLMRILLTHFRKN